MQNAAEIFKGIFAGIIKTLAAPKFKVGERVTIAGGGMMEGRAGRVRKITRDGLVITYHVSLEGQSATKTTPFLGGFLISRETPQTDENGCYYTPLFRTAGGNVVALAYPDLCAPTIEAARLCEAQFSESFTGAMFFIEGLRPTGDVLKVEKKGTYTTAELTLVGQKVKVVVVDGPDAPKGKQEGGQK